ncbi:hypothetical protein ABN09_02850 [Morganella morganii]|nr:hypothetical protein ABN09_02850 [Morganella morganii]
MTRLSAQGSVHSGFSFCPLSELPGFRRSHHSAIRRCFCISRGYSISPVSLLSGITRCAGGAEGTGSAETGCCSFVPV